MTDTTKGAFAQLKLETEYDDGCTSLMCYQGDCLRDVPNQYYPGGTYKQATLVSRIADDDLETVIEEARLHNDSHHRS